MPIAGDIVRYDGREWVVVDVAADEGEPPVAVLRSDDDPDLLAPLAVMAAAVQVTGHVQYMDGWSEDSPGIWGQA